MQKALWLYHDGRIHAFVFPDLSEDSEHGTKVSSACGRHVSRRRGGPAMGAARCLGCAESLGMILTDDDIRPKMGLGYRREPDRDPGSECRDCDREEKPWPSSPS